MTFRLAVWLLSYSTCTPERIAMIDLNLWEVIGAKGPEPVEPKASDGEGQENKPEGKNPPPGASERGDRGGLSEEAD